MNLAELVFIILFLTTLVTIVRLTVKLVRRRWAEVRKLSTVLASGMAAYVLVVVSVSLATPQEWVTLGQEQRFDDWALTVQRAERTSTGWHLTIRVANRGLGRPQRARDAEVLLRAADGRTFGPLPSPTERALTSMLQAGESFETVRDYVVSPDLPILGADVVHGAGPGPGWFVIGDRSSFFHRRPLVRLSTPATHAPVPERMLLTVAPHRPT